MSQDRPRRGLGRGLGSLIPTGPSTAESETDPSGPTLIGAGGTEQAAVPAPISSRIQQVVGQIGTGTFIANFATDFGQGILRETDNELDVSTTNGFFHIEGPDWTVYATRDGRFGRDANGGIGRCEMEDQRAAALVGEAVL